MSTDYNYDEQGQFFPYFILTITGLFTIPLTYSALKPGKELENTAPRIVTDYRPEHADIIDRQRRKVKRKQRRLKRMISATIGWAIMAYMVYLMFVTQRTIVKVWDPYDVLGVSRSATEKQITKYYRKLSITMHPDKRRPDPATNTSVESISNDWVEMTKAFKALTDEEIRRNYLEFGHPDGKQSFSIGIALPQFIVTEGNGKYVLLLYSALVGVLLPALVGTWWYGSQKMTKEQVLVSSAGKLFKEYEEEMNEGQVVTALSVGDEFKDVVKPDASLASIERMILKAEDKSLALTNEDREKLSKMSDEQRRQALALLWAYLGRADLNDAGLNEQKYASAPVAFALNEAFSTMAPFFGNTEPLLASHRLSQLLIQALPPGASPLLQLPHFTPDLARLVDTETGIKNTNVQAFMNIPEGRRRRVLTDLSSSEYNSATTVASQMPYARIEKAFFKVTGERYITPGSLIQLVVKVRIIPPGFSPVPPVDPKDLEDVDPKEGDLDALHGRKKKRPPVRDEQGNVVGGSDEDDEPIQPPLAHAPYFAQDHAPRWRIFLGENRSGKIAVPPFTFSTFDKPLFTFPADGPPVPTCNVQTLKCQFQAPPQAAEYPFTAHLICDSYVGFDSKVDVVMKVEEVKADEVESEDEISEPEEDSLAGQMAALKGGEAPKPRPKRRKIETADDMSSDSGTDEDEDDSDTDTDTDTSDEE